MMYVKDLIAPATTKTTLLKQVCSVSGRGLAGTLAAAAWVALPVTAQAPRLFERRPRCRLLKRCYALY